MGRKALSAFAKAKKRNKSEEATLPSALLDEIGPSDIAVSGPTSTWTSQVERKLLCGGHGGGDHACAPAVKIAALLPLKAWVEQRHATGAGIRTSAGGNGAARATSHLNLPQQTAAAPAAAHGGCEQHALNRVQCGATGGSAAAFAKGRCELTPTLTSAAADPKRALVHELQNDLSRMSLLLERLDELLSA